MRPLHIAGPYRGGQAIFRGVHEPQCFLLILEGLDGGHRPENLFPIGRAIMVQSLNQGRLYEEAVLQPGFTGLVPPATTEDASTLAPRRIDCGDDLVPVGPGDHGTHAGGGVHGVPDAKFGDFGHHGVPEAVIEVLLDQNARAAKADLTLIGIGSPDGCREGGIEIGITEDDRGVLTPKLQRELLEFRGRGSRNGSTRRGSSGEGDGPDVMVVHHGLTDLRAQTVEDVEHAVRQPGLLGPGPEHVSRHGGHLAGFGHHAVATGEGGRDFPCEQIERQVPRADATDHPKWFPQGVIDRTIPHGVAFARELLGGRGIEPQVGFCPGNVHDRGYGDGLSIVLGLGLHQGFGVFCNLVRQPHEYGPAIRGTPGAPARKSLAGRLHGGFYILRTGSGNPAVHLARCGLHIVQPTAPGSGDQLAVYEIENVLFHARR